MSNLTRFLLFFGLPVIAVLSYPPQTLANGLPLILTAVVVFGLQAWLLFRGRSLALTLAIFLQGLNVIIRLMMFFPRVTFTNGDLNVPYLLAALLGMGLSFYLMLRLDQGDVRVRMVA